MTDDLQAWLVTQPLDVPVEIDTARVLLKKHPGGAELSAYLTDSYTPAQLDEALRQGFPSALAFDAGLSISADGKDLLLTQWLPGIGSWPEVAQPLENLLNQLDTWRAVLSPPAETKTTISDDRIENRLRTLLAKGR